MNKLLFRAKSLQLIATFISEKLNARECVCVCVCASVREKERDGEINYNGITFLTLFFLFVYVCVCVCVCICLCLSLCLCLCLTRHFFLMTNFIFFISFLFCAILATVIRHEVHPKMFFLISTSLSLSLFVIAHLIKITQSSSTIHNPLVIIKIHIKWLRVT